MIGTTLSHYKIIEKLGSGGQGEVYLAEDSRLDRKVALKILPEHLSDRAELRERFEREARAVSSLNHPHICTLHDIGEQDGIHYLVMEHLEGETLSARLEKGALPLEQTLEYAIQIADALEAAHKQDIVHRDVKPSNIMLTPEEHVKVMDFGLAKRLTPVEGQEEEITTKLTKDDSFLGTVPYMSPEQLMGQEVDARSDIFSFGVVLYEMLAGVHPFKKGGQIETANAILSETAAPLSRYTNDISGLLQHAVKKMLAKEPDRRYQLIHEVRTDLAELMEESGDSIQVATGVTGAPSSARSWRQAAPWALAGVLAIIAVLLVANWVGLPSPSSPSVIRTVLTLPANQDLIVDGGADPLALSSDGQRLVYVARSEGRSQLYLRKLNEFEARPISGTEGARYPFFSPDGRWIAFFADGRLQRVSVDGGTPVSVCDVPIVGHGGTWGPDGTIVFDPGQSGLMRVASAGGTPELLTSLDVALDVQNHTWPRFLPNGRALLSTVGGELAVLSLETGQWHLLGPGSRARYLDSGHLLYYAGRGEMHAVPFDQERLTVRRAPVSVLDGVFRAMNGGAAYVAVSQTGTLVFAPGGLAHKLVRVDRDGQRTLLSDDRRGFRFPRLSPDGQRIAVTIDPRPSEIWIYDIERGSRIPLATDLHNLTSAWTPDGQRVAYSHSLDIYWRAADASSPAEALLARPDHVESPRSWFPDGRLLVFNEQHPVSGWDIWVLPMSGDPQPLVVTPAVELGPRFSPDGRWLAYSSDESGRNEVYVRPFPDVNEMRWTISTVGGWSPVWSRDGQELFYMNGAAVMAVPVEAHGETFVAGTPRLLFEGPYDTTQNQNFDVSPDGTWFVMVEPDPDTTPSRFHVVQNWFEELKRLVPTN